MIIILRKNRLELINDERTFLFQKGRNKRKTNNRYFYVTVIMYIHIGLIIPGSMYPLVLDVIDPLNKTRQMKFAPILEYFSGREKCILKIIFIYYLTMIAIGITIASTFGLLIACVQHACSMFILTGLVLLNLLIY